ncbi:UNVERIFIED_CONTAM: Serine/threonine-protein kinase PEPKR2 [Sesamum calycinum]|uniref:Serine/threonine-protein kinase PEPKR2 n=1 Tax=Sesamum calycinum TaxID=2727403 RepID=A0AAW2R8W0_9LAMI
MYCLSKKRKGVEISPTCNKSIEEQTCLATLWSHFSLEDFSRRKKKCKEVVVSNIVDSCKNVVNGVATAPACGTGCLEFRGRGLKRKIGCIDVATQLGRKKKIDQEYELAKIIGQGKFGSVVLCRSKATGEEFACKTLRKGEEIVHREVEIMQHLSGHPGVVTLKSVYEDVESFYLVMELCSGGRLLDQMAREGLNSEQKAAKIIKELMLAVRYCHEMGVVHRDIKPENILLTTSGQMKLADFGLAVRILDGQSLNGVVGSPAYVAPEVLLGNYSEKVDIWSAGVLLHALLVGVLPFQGDSLETVFEAIKKEKLDFTGDVWGAISQPARDLLSKMLTRSVSTRLTANEVLNLHVLLIYGTMHDPVDSTSVDLFPHRANIKDPNSRTKEEPSEIDSKAAELHSWTRVGEKKVSAMNKPASDAENTTFNANRNSPRKSSQLCSPSSPKLSIYLLAVFVILFVLFQIQSLQTPPTSPWAFMHQWEKIVTNSCLSSFHDSSQELKAMASKLRESVTFLPLKDLRFSHAALRGHMVHELLGRDRHDGSWNSYALAWPGALPDNATLMKGLTFVSYNHYDYHNIWHGLSAIMPFVAWHIKSQCAVPKRWILYHWGEIRTSMAPWVGTLLEATFGSPVDIETFDGIHRNESDVVDDDDATCFEEAVVMRHNEGGMSREKRMEVYDLMRCRSRMYCNVSSREKGLRIGMTMLMRNGPRSFKNASAVISIFEKECRKVEGCRLMVAYPHNLTFCEQVELMSLTDIVISAHGAQLSNMILMDRNSSVMELFPKGWLELAGVGQYVHHWLASWSGMRHEGAWRDPIGDHCPFPEDDRRCMSLFKNGRIGHNESYFSEWARNVLNDQVKLKTAQYVSTSPVSGLCGC